jgi:hypothetical protein
MDGPLPKGNAFMKFYSKLKTYKASNLWALEGCRAIVQNLPLKVYKKTLTKLTENEQNILQSICKQNGKLKFI